MTIARRALLSLMIVTAIPDLARGVVESCTGDCDGGADVTVDEVLTMVGIALGDHPLAACPLADQSCDAAVTVEEVLTGVDNALQGCPQPRGDLVVPASPAMGILRTLGETVVGGTPPMPAQYSVPQPEEAGVENYVTGLEIPWAMQFASDGRLFVTERPGRVRVVIDGGLQPAPWATIATDTVGESGLMGLALHPDFPQQPYVYLCFSQFVDGQLQNRVVRYTDSGGVGQSDRILVAGIPGSSSHDGCRLKFGPDRLLYASTGDGSQRALAQRLDSLGGKILRMHDDGSPAEDNPFPEAPLIWSYGHRNVQGLAFHPDTGELFETEHGPSGEIGIGAYDEVNLIQPGLNYGWPLAIGAPLLPQYRDPLLTYPGDAGPVPPSGASFFVGTSIPGWDRDLFFASLGARHLQRVGFDQCRRIVSIERLFNGVYGRLREVVQGPDGALYVSTSNRDGRGNPAATDDRILRISGAR